MMSAGIMSRPRKEAQTWTERVERSLDKTERFADKEAKAITADMVEELTQEDSCFKQPDSHAERITPKKRIEQILAKLSVEGFQAFFSS